MEQRRGSPAVAAVAKSQLIPQQQSGDLVCDIFSDIMTLAEESQEDLKKISRRSQDLKKRVKKINDDDDDARLTFPQIWVESFCESSEDEDPQRTPPGAPRGVTEEEEGGGHHLLRHQQRVKKGPATATFRARSKDKVIRSLHLTSCSTDVSFEGSLSASSSSTDDGGGEESRQGSFQLISRENSADVEVKGDEGSSSSNFANNDDSDQVLPDVTRCDQLNTTSSSEEELPEPPPAHPFRSPAADLIRDWLAQVEGHGFEPAVLQQFSNEVKYDEEDDTWFESGLVRVFDPYYDLDSGDISSVEGRVDPKSGLPVGKCTVVLQNGDELLGTFRDGLRQGRGSVEGANLARHGLVTVRGFYQDSVLVGRGIAILAPGGMWDSHTETVRLEGVFNDGYLEGPVRGLGPGGGLVFVGQYRRGIPEGACWLSREGQGWVHGTVDARGRFSGDDVAFVYPDLGTCLVGRFEEEVMVDAVHGRVVGAEPSGAGVLHAVIERPRPSRRPQHNFSFSPSDSKTVACEHLLSDPYETENAACLPSGIHGAGDGLFARRALPAGAVVAYYNGLRIEHGEMYSTNSDSNYEIYVDWDFTDKSAWIDIPLECVDLEDYSASLAHKANHGFDPNVQFVSATHPRFGRVPAIKTVRPVAAGEEILTHYKYDMAFAPTWYLEEYRRFSQDFIFGDVEQREIYR